MRRFAACFLAVLLLAKVHPMLAQDSPVSPEAPQRVSAGVMAGQLLTKVAPAYPPEAKAANVQGAVVMRAVIGKTGAIDQLLVLSGPDDLRSSAIDAVRQWTYKPYLLNGNPVAVDTTITVNYSLNPPIPAAHFQGVVMGITPTVAPAASATLPPGRIRVSAGVAASLIDTKKTPIYPEDAKAAHISGAVVLSGVVDTHGKVIELNVVDGPELLRQAAIDAVSQWTYKPYLLNGKPVEILTTMTVHFMLLD